MNRWDPAPPGTPPAVKQQVWPAGPWLLNSHTQHFYCMDGCLADQWILAAIKIFMAVCDNMTPRPLEESMQTGPSEDEGFYSQGRGAAPRGQIKTR